jgi:hypothetical protein
MFKNKTTTTTKQQPPFTLGCCLPVIHHGMGDGRACGVHGPVTEDTVQDTNHHFTSHRHQPNPQKKKKKEKKETYI